MDNAKPVRWEVSVSCRYLTLFSMIAPFVKVRSFNNGNGKIRKGSYFLRVLKEVIFDGFYNKCSMSEKSFSFVCFLLS